MDKFQWLFGFNGRINRNQLLKGQIIAFIPFILASFFAFSLGEEIGKVIIGLTMTLTIAITIFIFAKRYHDIDRSGWYILLCFVPVLNLYFSFFLIYCVPGTEGANRFGPPSC